MCKNQTHLLVGIKTHNSPKGGAKIMRKNYIFGAPVTNMSATIAAKKDLIRYLEDETDFFEGEGNTRNAWTGHGHVDYTALDAVNSITACAVNIVYFAACGKIKIYHNHISGRFLNEVKGTINGAYKTTPKFMKEYVEIYERIKRYMIIVMTSLWKTKRCKISIEEVLNAYLES